MLLSITTVSKWFNMSAKSSESGKEIRVKLTSATQFIKCRQFILSQKGQFKTGDGRRFRAVRPFQVFQLMYCNLQR